MALAIHWLRPSHRWEWAEALRPSGAPHNEANLRRGEFLLNLEVI